MAVLQSGSTRLTAALIGSLALNIFLWGVMAAGASRVAPIPAQHPIEVTRVVIDPKTNVVKPHIVKPVVRTVAKVPERKQAPKEVVHQHKAPPPPVQRVKVITQQPAKSGSPSDDKGFTAPPDGNVGPGKPINQGQGEIKPDPPKQDPPKQDPPKQDPPKQDPPPVKHEDPPSKPLDPPKKKGPTRDSEPTSQTQPEIPDSLKSEDLRTFVRVKVEIAEDGTFEVILRTSSGKPEVDKLILDALKKWKWKPALKDGEAIKSTQLFKFEIEVK